MGRHGLYDITEMMIRYGGSFVKALGQLFRLADNTNQAKLVAAFPELIDEYDRMATLKADQDARDAAKKSEGR